jgi:hypothetical protein
MFARLSSSRLFQAVLLAAILIVGGYQILFSGSRFDRARWLAADAESAVRADMVDDLLERYRLRERTRQQVLDLLGPATATDKWEDWELIYALGMRRGLTGGSRQWLLIDIAGDRVTAYRVVHE